MTRQTKTLGILSDRLEQSHLIKLQRMFLEHSSSPNKMYQDSLLLDYPNPAMDPHRIQMMDDKFEVDYLLHNLFRKCVISGVTPKETLEKAAYASFFSGERENVRTNRRLRALKFNDVDENTFVYQCQKMVAEILGELDLNKIAELSHFSAGATADLKRKDGLLQEKFAFRRPSVTRECAENFLHYLRREHTDASGIGRVLNIVEYNRVLTVPKSNSTDRTIAAEPTLNMFFQLGVGSYIRRRLRRFGIDLNDQTKNQELARAGSIDGLLATLDLRNASNSLSYEAVKLLLPPEWFAVLNSLRSPYGLVKGKMHRYRMFSSMGNGFTFELESLIFYVIARCASKHKGAVSVYGDDIIVATADALNVIKWLQFFGFTTNTDKSFITGFFRESCGKHYYFGYDVSPFFVRRLPHGLDIMLLFNNIVRWSTRLGLDTRFVKPMEYVLNLIPKDSRLFGPDGYGDGHLLEVPGVTPRAVLKYSRKAGAVSFKAVTLVFKRKRADQRGALCASLLGHTKEVTISSIADGQRQSYVIRDIMIQS